MRQFKTESKRILDLMINSIYTHREIFLRELISNASDATDKLYFSSRAEGETGFNRDDFAITIVPDRENRTLKISDCGIGMTKVELEENLGTIAKSGTLAFKGSLDAESDEELIGQFGVGFYAAFMVANKVSVTSRAHGSDEAWCWQSSGSDGYTVTAAERENCGTDVVLWLKDDTDDDKFDEFCDTYRLNALIKKYSDYIRYPIRMEMEKRVQKEGTDNEYESVFEWETLNSMTPLWKRSKSELTDEDYSGFYRDKFGDWEAPLLTIHTNTEGAVSYNALLFVPSRTPYNFYTKEFSRGLKLYTNGVLIMDNCAELLGEHFGFVRGLVDTQDVSLNISRETLQHDRQLKAIAKGLEKAIKRELLKMLQNDRENYEKLWEIFGLSLKFGAYRDYGANKDLLADLLLFRSLDKNELVTLDEYAEAMKDGQDAIYFAAGESYERISTLPQLELIRDKGYDVLCLTDDVDEFVMRIIEKHGDKPLKSAVEDAPQLTDDEKKAIVDDEAANRELLDKIKESLGGAVSEVKLSNRLKSSPACVSGSGGLSLEMERVLKAMPDSKGIKTERVLELNSTHPLFAKLREISLGAPETLAVYTRLVYEQALLAAGLPSDNPAAFAGSIVELLLK